ncbi:MAG TPA: polysaccharide biosynthesis tyrosine autokinase [Longimicrobiales bacterium]|nr:polysaccharide biosynthesis tyrosine autokinase [Longimicrobiales bacterium]
MSRLPVIQHGAPPPEPRARWSPSATPPMPAAAGGLSFTEIAAMLRRHTVLILGVVGLAAAGAGYQAWRERPLYRAAAVIQIRTEQGGLPGGLAEAGLELTRSHADPLLSHLQILRSRGVLGAVVDAEGLRVQALDRGFDRGLLRDVVVDAAVPPDTLLLRPRAGGYEVTGAAGTARAGYGERVALGGVAFVLAGRPAPKSARLAVLTREAAIDEVLSAVRAMPRDRTDIVDVDYTDHDAALAQRVVNAIVQEFAVHEASGARQESHQRQQFAEEQLARTDAALQAAQQELSAFRSRELAYSSREKMNAQESDLAAVELRRKELEADRGVYRALLSSLERSRPGSGDALRALAASPGVASNPVIVQLYSELARLESARDSLTTGEWRSAATDPDVVRLTTLIASTQEKLLATVRSHAAALDSRIGTLEALRSRGAADIQALPRADAEEARLVQQVQTVQKVAEQLRDEYERARLAEAGESGPARIIDLAPLPTRPVRSRRAMIVALGVIFGLILGGGGAFGVELTRTSIRRQKDVQAVLRMPILSVVPRLDTSRRRRFRRGEPAEGVGAGARLAPELVGVAGTDSFAGEAYRALRTNLLYSAVGGTLKSVVLTGVAPADGKTTTAANLAVVFAHEGFRTLLVDGDLRRGRVHALFGMGESPGLAELVTGECSGAEAVRATPVEGLYLIPRGAHRPDEGRLLRTEPLRRLIGALTQRFDLVLIDTPPILGLADAAVFAALADGVVLVVRAGATDRAAAQLAVDQLAAVGARVLGAVLNDPDAEVPRYGGYYAYGYRYGGARAGR